MKLKTILKKVALISLVGWVGSALAITPANTKITNTATLDYTGLSAPITASVAITVDLTPTAASMSAPTDITTAGNQSVTYSYTIVSAANGSDTYDLTGSFPTITNLAGTSAAPVFNQGAAVITDITLGSTSANALASIGSFVINVPSDGTADTAINNLVAGDTIVIAGNTYTIAAGGISDNGTVASITLTSGLLTALAVGDLIPESKVFTVTIPDVGSLVAPGSAASIVMNVTATSQTDGTKLFMDPTFTTVVAVTFQKLVRNVTAPSGVGGGTLIGGQTYFATAGDVRARSGNTLEYVLRVTAPASSPLAGVRLSDTIPAFTTYVAASTTLNGAAAGVPDALGVSALVAGVLVNDNGGVSALNSGDVAAGATVLVTFRVIVD